MKQFIFKFTFVLIVCASAKEQPADPKTKEMQVDMKRDMGQGKDDMQTANLMDIMKECNNSFAIDMSFLQALNDSGSFPDESDRTPKCYIRCVLEKTGVASEQGKYDPQLAAMFFGGERGGKVMTDVEDLAQSCATRDEKCRCERAYQFMKCLMEKEIEEYDKAT